MEKAMYLKVEAHVRYWEDGEVDGVEDANGTLIPWRVSDKWCPCICLDTGVVESWPIGTTAKIHYKVCDAGRYILLDEDGNRLAVLDGYVPKIMSPGGEGFGDYIIMSIGPDGKIENWRMDLTEFTSQNGASPAREGEPASAGKPT